MKKEIIELLNKYEYKLVEDVKNEANEEGFAIIFEGPILTNSGYSELIAELAAISDELEFMMFMVDEDTMLFAVFSENLKGYVSSHVG